MAYPSIAVILSLLATLVITDIQPWLGLEAAPAVLDIERTLD